MSSYYVEYLRYLSNLKVKPVCVVDEDDEDPDAGTQVWPAYFMQQAYSETKRAKISTIKLIPGQWRLRFDTGQTYNYATEDIFTTPEQAYEAIHARTDVFSEGEQYMCC